MQLWKKVILFMASFGALAAGLRAGENPGPSSRENASGEAAQKTLTAGMKGVHLEFKAIPMAEGKGGQAEEMKAILEATALLKTERSIRYRRTTLTPGQYAVTVESSGGKSFYFVIGPKVDDDEEEDADEKVGKVEVKGGMGVAGRLARARPEKGSEKKETEGNPAPKKEAEKAPEEKTKKGSEKGPAAPINKIRAVFRLANNPNPTKEVLFDLRPVQGGSRFELSVKAGSTLGKANISLVEEAAK